MSHGIIFTLAFAFAFSAMTILPQSKRKSGSNQKPTISLFSSSLKAIVRCDKERYDICTTEEVSLTTEATDPDGDPLKYRYSVNAGKISGRGSSVVWDLKEAANGRFVVKVQVTDGKGGESSSELSLVVADGPKVELVPPPCPYITVECPKDVNFDGGESFSAKIVGDTKKTPIRFHWRVNLGEIVKGQGTRKIKVRLEPRWYPGDLTATVSVRGLDPSCLSEASCTSNVWLPDPPPCPTIMVTCPDEVLRSEPFNVTATISGGPSGRSRTLKWTVSEGKIVKGQGSAAVTVDTKNAATEVKTIVKVGGYDSACPSVASCISRIKEQAQ
jgi:hypothetical protein